MSKGAYLTDLRAADKKAQEIINQAYETRRLKKQSVETQANKELEVIKKQLAAEYLGAGGGETKTSEAHKQSLKEETDKKLAALQATAEGKKKESLALILHFVTKVNPKANKKNVQAYQQKAIQSVA
mmetsp:Transcript_5461/g.10838  ORF Transcript_5461/g.10838 Transcript_5461/m.10838 type:complete len:127 (-) Transcript_5461:493-873(-)|eukprot:CAMPEP_0170167026 /NCGR_PEP_ID=MMETSP0040_2-20121228/543_1 /TAXON_ID=641309 /ORGANISM="Lotharella oceanica, Strain CCMP622" /LENGTH=126 /DNA_ID=CAMNT_0010404917 /DNA_START=30 /DNA_END=410 /DNA_ORIENTATION=+